MFFNHGPSLPPAFSGISLEVRTPGHRVGGVGEVESQDTQTGATLAGTVMSV